MLIAVRKDGFRIEAAQAVKGPDYICPGCKESVTLAKGRIRRHYFGHRPGAECRYSALESWEHEQAKEDIAATYRGRGLICDLEVDILSINGDRRADVLLRAPDGVHRIAIEVQYSPLDYSALEHRTAAYFAAGVPVVWMPVLIRKRLASTHRIAGTNIYYVGQYSAAPWQWWIHDLQDGLWFYDPVLRGAWRATLDNCMLYRNPTSWFADGDEQSAGGHWYPSARWSSLFLEGPIDLARLRVRRVNRAARNRRTYHLPGGVGADFVLASNDSEQTSAVRLGRVAMPGGGDSHYYVPQQQVEGEWREAGLKQEGLPDTSLVRT